MVYWDLWDGVRNYNLEEIILTDKDKYHELCKVETSIPIFSRDWWLDAVAPDVWDVVTVEKNGNIVATLPYVLIKIRGFTHIAMPPLTQKLGPWLKYPTGQKYSKKLDYEKNIFNELIAKLPVASTFDQNFDYKIKNWLPFYWQGFQQTTRYTYVIPDLTDMEQIYNSMASDIRKQLRKAEKKVSCEVCDDVELLYRVTEKTYKRQNLSVPYTMSFLRRLVNTCIEHESGRMYIAKDGDERIHAVSFMIWDENSAYYLIGGADPDLRQSSAQVFLLWNMIKDAAKITQAFDFEGTMLQHVNRTFRNFATVQKSYYRVSKTCSKKYALLKHLLDIGHIIIRG